MNTNIDNLISEAKNQFEKDLAASGYSAITGSSRQLENILYTSNPVNGHSYLDIGTGNGFIAFAIARSFPKAIVTGIDLSEKIININNENAKSEGLDNLSFKVDELNEIFNKSGFTVESVFFDEITFPREYDSSYEALINKIPDSLKESYKLKLEGNKLYISLRVMNTLFRK